MELNKILLEWGIDNQNVDDFFEYLTSTYPKHCYYIDHFPMQIKSFEKYEQVELYFKKVINNEASKEFFKMEELKFVNVLKKLWLYNQVLMQTNLLELSNDEINMFNENKSAIINLKKNIKNSKNDTIIIEKVSHLDLLIKLSIRESLYSKILFLDQKILVIAYGLCFQVFLNDLSSLNILKTVVSTEGLYLRPFESK